MQSRGIVAVGLAAGALSLTAFAVDAIPAKPIPENTWIKLDGFEGGGEVGWVYDEKNKVFLKYGGCDDNAPVPPWQDKGKGSIRRTPGYSNRMLAFDAGARAWTEQVAFDPSWPKDRPPNGCTRAQAYDPVEGVVYHFGGNASYGWGDYTQLWKYDAAANRFTAVPVLEGKRPGRANTCGMAVDFKNRLIVLTQVDQYAVFNIKEGKWSLRPGPKGVDRFYAYDTLSYNPDTGKMLYIGKRKISGPRDARGEDDTEGLWFKPGYDNPGKKWFKFQTATFLYAAAVDRWAEAKPAHEPPPRWRYGLAYDSDKKAHLLVGGCGGNWDSDERYFNDTWVYLPEKNDWVEMKPDASIPLTRQWMPLDYDKECKFFVQATKGTWAYRLPETIHGDAKK